MIIVGIPSCSACKVAATKYPGIRYVELSFEPRAKDEFEEKVKRAIFNLKVAGYPVILSDDLETIVKYPNL